MKKLSLITKILTVFCSFIFVFLVSTTNVGALYDSDLDKVLSYKVDRNRNQVSVEIQYQYGIKDVELYICEDNTCSSGNFITSFLDSNDEVYINESNNSVFSYTKTYYAISDGKSLLDYNVDKQNNNMYNMTIYANFCMVRDNENEKCLDWTGQKEISTTEFDITLGSPTGNPDADNFIYSMLNVVHTYVIPGLWVVLIILLLVRGIMLSIDIVKSSDEPDVRKRKIQGLVWLIIGVAIGFAVTVSARYVLAIFDYGGAQ